MADRCLGIRAYVDLEKKLLLTFGYGGKVEKIGLGRDRKWGTGRGRGGKGG